MIKSTMNSDYVVQFAILKKIKRLNTELITTKDHVKKREEAVINRLLTEIYQEKY